MHLKNIAKKMMVFGLVVSMLGTDLAFASTAEQSAGADGKAEISVVESTEEAAGEKTENDLQGAQDPADGAGENTDDVLSAQEDAQEQQKQEKDTVSEDDETAGSQEQNPGNGENGSAGVKTVENVEEEKKFELTKAEFTDTSEKEFEIELSNCEVEDGGLLKAAVWSEDKEQDDLKWLPLEKTAENTYGMKIKIKDFKSLGQYVAHIYYQKKDGSNEYVGGKKFLVTEMSGGKVTLDEQKYEDGKASIKVSEIESPSGIESVRVAVWSAADQKDMHWYDAKRQGDAWYINMDIASYHKNNWSLYTAHVYAVDGNGFQKYVGGVKVDFSLAKTSAVVTLDKEKKSVNVAINQESLVTPGKFDSIRCAVWSEEKGQDDLKWYTLEYNSKTKKWEKDIPLTTFRSTGTCYAHIYLAKTDKTQIYLTGNTFKLDKPSLKTATVYTDNEKGSFGVTMSGLDAPIGYQKLEAAIWSQANQSDIKWYEAKAQSGGSFVVNSTIAQHKYNTGKYNIHIYVTDTLGIKTCLKCISMEFKTDIGKLTVVNDPKETSYKVTLPVNAYPAGLSEVRFGVWSKKNQSDLKWYTATKSGNNYTATVDIKNHKTMGTYSVHVYGKNKAGNLIYLIGNGALFSVKGTASGNITVTDRNEKKGTFKVVMSNMSAASGISSVRLAAWTQSNQSDLYWYTCTKQSDGTWAAVVDVSKHKYNSGTYNLHVYSTMGNQIQSYTKGTTYKFEPKNLVYVLNDQGKGKRTIVICNPSSTSNLRFAVWSDVNGQDDLYWYTASKGTGGKWTATVNSNNHKDGGNFKLHAYAGSSTCLNTSTFTIPASEMAKNGWYYETLNGKTYKLYYINDVLQKDVSGVIGRQSSYKAEVNRTTCTVTIYAKDGANGYIIPVKVFACSVGLPSTPTPTGTYYTSVKYRWHELMGPSYGQYCTRIVGEVLFHSVAGSNMTSYNLSATEYNKLGSPASHGCVRLCVRDAKWIYDNCSLGMETRIYDSSYPGPFGKPATIKIPASQNWDPTDPNV